MLASAEIQVGSDSHLSQVLHWGRVRLGLRTGLPAIRGRARSLEGRNWTANQKWLGKLVVAEGREG